VSLCGLKNGNYCPQALIRPRARSDDPEKARTSMARLTLNLGQIMRFMPIWLTSRTFPTFVVGLLPPPLPPLQVTCEESACSVHGLSLCVPTLMPTATDDNPCSSCRAANSITWAIVSPQVESSPLCQSSSASTASLLISLLFVLGSIPKYSDFRPSSTTFDCSHTAGRLVWGTRVWLSRLHSLHPTLMIAIFDPTGVGILLLLFAGQFWRKMPAILPNICASFP
jgi:hypothetical protein